jgi:GTPase Era involved in 16S rRNA processing
LNVSLNEQTILERWRVDFENLYNGSGSKEFDNDHYNQAISDNDHYNQAISDNDHYNQAISDKNIRERIMEEQLYQCNNEINHDISIQEVTDTVMRAKNICIWI